MKKSTVKNIIIGVLVAAVIVMAVFLLNGQITGKAIFNNQVRMVVLNDERCDECDISILITQLESIFPTLKYEEVDYSDAAGKKLYESTNVGYLPAILFDDSVKQGEGYQNIQAYLVPAGKYLSLRIGASFDPTKEICDNQIDDDGDGEIDCEDEDCKGIWKCAEKKEIPIVELFVMSHCPYGTQIEKGILPVVELLGDKIDFKVKFCDYAMHSKVELDEQTRQYCIQKEQNDKFIDYLKCFLKEGKSDECITETNIGKTKLNACIQTTDEKFEITKNYEDKSTYKGNYPTFNIHKAEVDEYSVGGSPTLVINGVQVATKRDSASLLNTICTGFKEKPEECNKVLSSENPSAGFGFSASTSASSGSCG